MSRYNVKVYVVQRADAQGNPVGAPVGAKLTFAAAHQVAKDHAPAKVTCVVADKTDEPNWPGPATGPSARS